MMEYSAAQAPTIVEARFASDGMGTGLFATVDIPKGTRILAEAPFVILLSSSNPFEQFSRVVKLLTSEQLHELDSLHCSPEHLNDNFASNIMEGIQRQVLPNGPDRLMLRRFAIYRTNCTKVSRKNIDVGSAVFPKYSRINHSCIPNVYNIWNETLNRETVHAGQDIKVGEQLFVSYLASKGVFMNRTERAALLSPWGFQCRCRSCLGAVATDAVREQMIALDLELTRNLHQYQFLSETARTSMVNDGITKATLLLRLLNEAGLGGSKLCQA